MSDALQEARDLSAALNSWLSDAFTLWWERGADHENGGFHERLKLDGSATGEPRRARLHPRQIYSFSVADELGWEGPSEEAVQHGLDFYLAHYPREDRLMRTLVDASGKALDEKAVLYDQAFALLGYAYAYDTLDDEALRDSARDLHDQLRATMSNQLLGFEESNPRILPLLSNSHMHLFEACLAWMDLDHDTRWQTLASQIVELSLTRFVDPKTG